LTLVVEAAALLLQATMAQARTPAMTAMPARLAKEMAMGVAAKAAVTEPAIK